MGVNFTNILWATFVLKFSQFFWYKLFDTNAQQVAKWCNCAMQCIQIEQYFKILVQILVKQNSGFFCHVPFPLHLSNLQQLVGESDPRSVLPNCEELETWKIALKRVKFIQLMIKNLRTTFLFTVYLQALKRLGPTFLDPRDNP